MFGAPVIIQWQGGSGTLYNFQREMFATLGYEPVIGIYAFCKELPDASWQITALGVTDNLQRTLQPDVSHDVDWDAVRKSGTTHVSTYLTNNLALAYAIERDLRAHPLMLAPSSDAGRT